MSWNDLSMRDRAAFIKVGVKNGLYSIQDIQKAYNKFAEGGFLNEEDDEEDDEKYYALHPELRGRLRTYPPKPNKEDVEKVIRRENKTKRELDLIQSSLNNRDSTFSNVGEGYKKASNTQESEAKEKWNTYKKGIEAVATAAELVSATYMLGKGAKALNLLPNNSVINGIYQSDKGQVIANSLGTVADAYQLFNADTTKDKIENSIELPADVGGIIGGTNAVRNSRFFGRYGNSIDNVLDFMGYGAAGYDAVVKPAEWIYSKLTE